jgi:hypothetical protein
MNVPDVITNGGNADKEQVGYVGSARTVDQLKKNLCLAVGQRVEFLLGRQIKPGRYSAVRRGAGVSMGAPLVVIHRNHRLRDMENLVLGTLRFAMDHDRGPYLCRLSGRGSHLQLVGSDRLIPTDQVFDGTDRVAETVPEQVMTANDLVTRPPKDSFCTVTE